MFITASFTVVEVFGYLEKEAGFCCSTLIEIMSFLRQTHMYLVGTQFPVPRCNMAFSWRVSALLRYAEGKKGVYVEGHRLFHKKCLV